jgi:hypothetical protein
LITVNFEERLCTVFKLILSNEATTSCPPEKTDDLLMKKKEIETKYNTRTHQKQFHPLPLGGTASTPRQRGVNSCRKYITVVPSS